jgi:hypothetical protein
MSTLFLVDVGVLTAGWRREGLAKIAETRDAGTAQWEKKRTADCPASVGNGESVPPLR